MFAAVLERAAADVQASLDDLAASFGSAYGLLAHVLAQAAHGRAGQARIDVGASGDESQHKGAAYGVLFADAIALGSDPDVGELAHAAFRAMAGHLADLVARAQADGDIRLDVDPQAAAWLLLSLLSSYRLRAQAMPVNLEHAVTALALGALATHSARPDGHSAGSRDRTAS